jgi:putative restriction endonuclease
MNYWWVNHKQTVQQEVEGGYLWSPKRESNGNRSQYYSFMRETRIGDFVVSFANARIGQYGIINGFPLSAPKPDEFGPRGKNWSDEGWYVSVAWTSISKPFRPKDNIERIRPFLPGRYSPIQRNGNGNQKAYLTKIDQELFGQLMEIGQFDPRVELKDLEPFDRHDLVEKIEGEVEKNIEDNRSVNTTEHDAVVKARKGQGVFRRRVRAIESNCRVSGLNDPRLLIASHIKPWRVCETASERLDGSNGLMLAPHIDRLFDIGLISFKQNGELLVSQTLGAESAECLGLTDAMVNGVGSFSMKQEFYLTYHRESVFLD